jgi:hypothetical protein
MTDDGNMTDAKLEALFETARATSPVPSDDLIARVLKDADAMQPVSLGSGWRGWLGNLGGLPGLGGLITASCVGFWLGVAPPAGLPDLAATVLGVESVLDEDLDGASVTAFGWDIEEG